MPFYVIDLQAGPPAIVVEAFDTAEDAFAILPVWKNISGHDAIVALGPIEQEQARQDVDAKLRAMAARLQQFPPHIV